MWPLVLLVPLVVAYVGSERPQTQTQSPEPPTGVRVQGSVVSWSPAPPLSRTYSVQAWSLDTKQWRDTSCVRTPDTSCDVAATMKKADFGCARLRVHAHEHNLTSRPVEACSPRGSYCSPEVKLSSQPDTLTVHLSGNTELVRNHGSAVQHMIYYGEDGKPPKCLREPFSVRSEQVYKFSEERWNHISQIVPLEDRYPPSPPAPQ
ncbi:unnamed protein product [Merluccius merluccius]